MLLNSGSVVHSRKVTRARIPPSIPISAENMRSVSVSRKGGKLGSSRHGEVEVDEDVDCDESSESTGVRSRVTARESCTGGWSRYCHGYFVERLAIKEVPCTPVNSSAGALGGFAMSTPSATSAGINASGGTVSSRRVS